MLPDVAAEDRLVAFHDWVVLIRCGNNLQLAGLVNNQPRPTASETTDAGGLEFLFEGIEAAESRVDIIRDFSAWSAAAFGHQFPEHRVVGMSAAVVAHDAANVRR